MSETGGLKAIEVPSFCWLSSNCNKMKRASRYGAETRQGQGQGLVDVVGSDHLNGL